MNSINRVMDICNKVDDVIWGDSQSVWDDVFRILMCETVRLGVLVNTVEMWVNSKISEFDTKYRKVSDILELVGESEGVTKLLIHYQHIAWQYRSAFDCCKSVEYSI